MPKETTIKISKEFKEKLRKIGRKGETFEEILCRFIPSIPASAPSTPYSIPYEGNHGRKRIDGKDVDDILRSGKPVFYSEDGNYYEGYENL